MTHKKMYLCLRRTSAVIGAIIVGIMANSDLYAFAVPTNVRASRGTYNDRVEIEWDTVGEGAYYRVYRSLISISGSSWIVATSFQHGEPAAQKGVIYEYTVRSATTSTGSSASQHSSPAAIGFIGFPLAEYNQAGLIFETGGGTGWVGQYGADGVSHQVISGLISHNEQTWIQATVAGTGAISFDWKTDSETSWDKMNFTINGVVTGSEISSNGDWVSRSHDVVGQGPFILKWTYSKDASDSSGLDCAWLRNVVWIPADGDILVPPSEVHATDGNHMNFTRVSWNSVAQATHYQVWRSASMQGAKTLIADWMPSLTYDDWGGAPGTEYWYFVRAASGSAGQKGSDFSQPEVGYSAVQPQNDYYSEAVDLLCAFGGSAYGDCSWAGWQIGEPNHGGFEDATNSVWWCWTAVSNAVVSFEVSGTNPEYEAVLAVYTNAGSTVATLVGMTSETQSTETGTRVTFTAQEGAKYFLAVAGRNGIGAPVTLRWAVDGWLCSVPPNVKATEGTLFETIRVTWDDVPGATHYEVWRMTNPNRPQMIRVGEWANNCVFEDNTAKIGLTYYYAVKAATDTAGWLAGPLSDWVTGYSAGRPLNDNMVSALQTSGDYGQVQGNNALATAEMDEPLHADLVDAVNSVWYAWVAPSNASYTFTVTPSSNAVWRPVIAVYTNTSVECNPISVAAGIASAEGDKAQVQINAVAGQTNYLAVTGTAGTGGEFTLEWALSLLPPAAVAVTEGTAFWVTLVQWEAVAGATHYEVSRAVESNGVKEILSGSIENLSFEDWTGDLSVTYYYFVRAMTEAWGGIESDYSAPIAGWAGDFPQNDDRANAERIEGVAGTVSGNSLWATREPGEPQHGGYSDAGNSVWWQWTAPVSAPITFTLRNEAQFNAVLAVYSNSVSGIPVAVAAAGGAGVSAVVDLGVEAVAGKTYWLAVAGRPDAGGPITLEWSYGDWRLPAPVNMAASQDTINAWIDVSWDPVAAETVYELSRATEAGGAASVIMSWTNAVSFQDVNVTPGQRYYYYVRAALDDTGVMASEPGGPAEGWTHDDEPPVSPVIDGFTFVELSGGKGLRFVFNAQAGVTYEVVTVDKLGIDLVWQPLDPPVLGVATDDGVMQLDVPVNLEQPQAFFKIEASR